METPNYPWSLWAYCPTTKKKTLVARGPESEMRNIFDRLVRRGDRLALVDAAGDKQSTTAGALTDHAEPEAVAYPLGPNERRLNVIEQTNTTIARRIYAIERKQYEDRKIRESYQAGQDHRLAEVEQRTYGLAERLVKLADAITPPAAIESLERRLSNLETAQPSDCDKLSQALERIDALEQLTTVQDDRLDAYSEKLSQARERIDALAIRINHFEIVAKANAQDIKRNLDEGRPVREAVLRFDAITPRINRLEQLTKTNFEDITNDRTEARNLAETVGNIHHDLKGAVGDLRRDLETLAAQVDETTQAVAKLATAQPVADRDHPGESLEMPYDEAVVVVTFDTMRREIKGLDKRLTRQLVGLASELDSLAKSVATAQPVASPDSPATLRDDLNTLENEIGSALAEISRLRERGDETTRTVAKITSALSILSAFNRPTAPPNA